MRLRACVTGAIVVATLLSPTAAGASTGVAHPSGCGSPAPSGTAAAVAVPALVQNRGSGGQPPAPAERLIGHGDLWVLRAAVVGQSPTFDVQSSRWLLKVGWFRARSGPLAIRGRRLDGTGRFSPSIPPVASYGAIGFLPTLLSFSTGGCWQVTGRLRRSTVVFSVRFSSSPSRICRQLLSQRQNVDQVLAAPGGQQPGNVELANALQAAITARGCSA